MTAINKYFVGGELEAFVQGATAAITWTTDAGTYDSNFARGSVLLHASNGNYIPIRLASAQNTFWLSYQEYRVHDLIASGLTNNTWMALVDGSLAQKFRIQGIGGTEQQPVIQFQYWNGSAWIAVAGTAVVCPTDTRHKFDINIDNATGGIKAYMDGIPFATGTGLSNYTIAEAQMYCVVAGGPSISIYYSEVQCLDVSTLGRRLATLGEVSNGTNSDWTGSVTDINEIGSFNDSNFIQTGTANQVSTFVNSSPLSSVAQQYLVSGLIIAGRILIGAVGPQNLKGVVVLSGTNYYSTNDVANLLTVFGYTWADFPQNPATSADWTVAQLDTPIETGWQSLA